MNFGTVYSYFRMDPTVENTVDGTMVCDINLFSRLSLLAERVKWYDQIPRARQDRYNAIFEECARILQKTSKSIKFCLQITRPFQAPPTVDIRFKNENAQ